MKKLSERAINFHLFSDIRALKSISRNGYGMKDSKLDFNASANRRATREREREKSRWKHESRYTLLRSYSRCWFELGCNTHENVPSFRWGTTQRTRSRGKTRAVVNQYFQLSSMVPGRSLEKAQRVSFGSRCSSAEPRMAIDFPRQSWKSLLPVSLARGGRGVFKK